jgi:Cys-rich protein (TIGR01571 family)
MKATVFMATTALLSVGQVLAGGTLAEDSDASAPNKRPMPGDHGADDLPTPPPMHHDPMHMGAGGEEMPMPHDGHMHHGNHHDGDHMHHGHGHHGRGQMHCHMLPALVFICLTGIAMITAVRVANRQKGFSTPAHGCFSDWSSCLLTSCCPCVAYGKVAEFSLGVPWYLMCCAITCCNNFHCCLGLASRHELRRKLDIEGNWCEDACVHAFAQPCALCQEVREVDLVNRGERAVGVVNAVPATTYQVQAPEGTVAGQTLQMQTPSGLVACVVPAGVAAGDVFNIQVNAPVVDAQPAAQAMDIEMEGLSKPLMV